MVEEMCRSEGEQYQAGNEAQPLTQVAAQQDTILFSFHSRAAEVLLDSGAAAVVMPDGAVTHYCGITAGAR